MRGSDLEVKPMSQENLAYFQLLMDRYGRLIWKLASIRLKGKYPDSIEDAVQDTYMSMCRQVNEIRDARSEKALICTIASRCATKEFFKRVALDSPLPPSLVDKPYNPGLDEILPSSTAKRDREVLIRIFHENATAVEVAKDFGGTPEAVRAEKKRALDHLRERLKQYEKRFKK